MAGKTTTQSKPRKKKKPSNGDEPVAAAVEDAGTAQEGERSDPPLPCRQIRSGEVQRLQTLGFCGGGPAAGSDGD